MKEKSGKRRKLVLSSLFVLLVTAALLAGTVTAVAHTEVESVTRSAPTAPAPGVEFEVRLTITGELPLVVGIVETIPEDFRFPEKNENVSKFSHFEVDREHRKIAFAAIDETLIKYTVIAPSSGEGTFKGEWVDLLVLTNKTAEEEGKEGRWHTVAPEKGTSIIIGGGGTIEEEVTVTPTPTPFVPAVTKASRVVPVMEAGKEIATAFKGMDVSMIALKSDVDVSNVEVKVERVERTPDTPEPSGVAYTYLDITEENAEGAKIEGKIEFKVAKSWLVDNNIDEATVKLNRYDGNEGWKALPSTKVGEDDDFVFFEAETPGFSTFAVTGEKKEEVEKEAAATPTPTPAIAASTPAAIAAPAATAGPTAAPASEVPGFGDNLPALSLIFVVFFAIVAVALISGYVFGKRGKGGNER